MIMFQVAVEPGFRKGDMNNIPNVSSDMVCIFVKNVGTAINSRSGLADGEDHKFLKSDAELKVDFVQVRRIAEMCEVRLVTVPIDIVNSITINANSLPRVTIKVNTKLEAITETACDQCTSHACQHIMTGIFWLHRKSSDAEAPAIRDFWGTETECLAEAPPSPDYLRVRDLFVCDELRLEGDIEAANNCDETGQLFIEAVLSEMEGQGLRDTGLFKHFRPQYDECEPLFIHHAMVDAVNDEPRDVTTFVHHMEEQARHGLVDRLSELTKTAYKSPLWLEAQYMRIRCSLVHAITLRKNTTDDEEILKIVFSQERTKNVTEKQQLKQHKRFILKQTEKLENKTYQECGLLVSESYPFVCATPDGITDDHIVEIKVPKTEEQFEEYLEGRETISAKYMAQLQVQMFMANVTKALYCVLSPSFDENGALHYVWVQADMEFAANLLGAAEGFWKDVVYPRLAKIYYN